MRRSEAGFTLLEAVCTLSIIALVASVALPALPRATSRPRLESLAVATAAVLIEDRNAAIRRSERVATRLDADASLIVSGASGRVVRLPPDVAFGTILAETCEGRPSSGAIEFLANGMSCGGTVFLRHADAAYEIRVNWLTGGVEVAPGRAR